MQIVELASRHGKDLILFLEIFFKKNNFLEMDDIFLGSLEGSPPKHHHHLPPSSTESDRVDHYGNYFVTSVSINHLLDEDCYCCRRLISSRVDCNTNFPRLNTWVIHYFQLRRQPRCNPAPRKAKLCSRGLFRISSASFSLKWFHHLTVYRLGNLALLRKFVHDDN